MSLPEAASGIRRIVDMRMADEVRVYAAKRGVDARDFTLLPFGGAGAVHAAAVADELGVARILVPPRPGAFSALGLLCSDVVHDYVRSELRPMEQVPPAHAEAIFRALEARAKAELADEGLGGARAARERALDMRYTGQGYELTVPLAGVKAPLTQGALGEARQRFDELHARLHFHAASDRPVEIVSYRLRVRVSAEKYVPERAPARARACRARECRQGLRARCASRPRARRARASYERDRLLARRAPRRAGDRRAVRRHHRHPARLARHGGRILESRVGAEAKWLGSWRGARRASIR